MRLPVVRCPVVRCPLPAAASRSTPCLGCPVPECPTPPPAPQSCGRPGAAASPAAATCGRRSDGREGAPGTPFRPQTAARPDGPRSPSSGPFSPIVSANQTCSVLVPKNRKIGMSPFLLRNVPFSSPSWSARRRWRHRPMSALSVKTTFRSPTPLPCPGSGVRVGLQARPWEGRCWFPVTGAMRASAARPAAVALDSRTTARRGSGKT